MKILYTAMRWDYGKKRQGESHEQVTMHHTMVKMGHEVEQFDPLEMVALHGKAKTQQMLIDKVKQFQPAVMYTVLFTDEIDYQTIETITKTTDTLTFNWFTDDHWRFENYSQHMAPAFNYVATTDADAMPKYAAIGYDNVILSQWACNHYMYKPTGNPLRFDVTFIGQPHGNRKSTIKYLRKNGVDVKTWGTGWPEGRLTQEEMIHTFADSKVNLNLSNSSTNGGWRFWRGVKRADQIKGRNFEVPGCGGFLLTGRVPYLERYFEIGKEVVCFDDKKDMLEKTKYYLAHDEQRQAIAKAGYERTLRDHTYEIRIREIFKRMGLKS